LANPSPDINAFVDAVMGRTAPDRPPMVEYIVDEVVMRPAVELAGRTWVPHDSNDLSAQKAHWDNFIAFWHAFGYDFVRLELAMHFPAEGRVGIDPTEQSDGRRTRTWSETDTGPIGSWEDFETFPWPQAEDVDLFPLEYICEHMPEGMGLLSCHAGGILEHVSRLMGYVGLCTALYDAPDLVQAIVDRVGGLIEDYHRRLLGLDRLAVVFQGDDMGFRSGTLVSPDHMRDYFLPWHKRFAEVAHQAGRPYFLHSCGNLEAIMDDLIDDVGIDAKHSFEDAIAPVTEMKRRYGERIGILGGVDVDVLGRASPEEVRRTVRSVIDACAPGGRYAVGSGNSIPSYIPVENFLTMLDEALA
jgi:uroporphyrinogen decarboxylase